MDGHSSNFRKHFKIRSFTNILFAPNNEYSGLSSIRKKLAIDRNDFFREIYTMFQMFNWDIFFLTSN